MTNAQGDVIALYDYAGVLVCTYEYDAWGNLASVKNANGAEITSQNHIAFLNPIRYRGYYFDNEIGMYYLQSRYYDPSIGRFINADGYITTGQGVLSYNMFAYCLNNPVMLSDPSGECSICEGIKKIIDNIKLAITVYKNCNRPLTEDEKVLIATIASEATVTVKGEYVSVTTRQAMANVALNRVGSAEWSNYTTVAQVCANSGFDGYGNKDYQKCMDYLNNRDGSNKVYESIIYAVMRAYAYDITDGCQLYYTPASMVPVGSVPDWNFGVLTEVNIRGVDPYYEGRFYKYSKENG